jgi:hypothetical protein
MKFFAILFLLCSILLSTQAQVDSEVIEVYQASLDGLRKCDNFTNFILKEFSTKGRANYTYIKNTHYGEIDSLTIIDFEKKESLSLSFISCPSIKEILSDEDISSNWKKLKKQYKNLKTFEITSVGFNQDKSQAILKYMEEGESYLATESYWVILEKIDGNWKIVKKINAIVY